MAKTAAIALLILIVSFSLGIRNSSDFLTEVAAQSRPTLYWGSTGEQVKLVQWKLQDWGYYDGSIDGNFQADTSEAVRKFQAKNGLKVDGIVGPETWQGLGLGGGPAVTGGAPSRAVASRGVSASDDVNLLARLVAAEAQGEPYKGQVAVAAVILNRVRSSKFPNSLSGVIYQPHAFESITNGLAWNRSPDATAVKAARDAMNGWDPTQGCLFFWNPTKPVTGWIWSRPIVIRIGDHVFAL